MDVEYCAGTIVSIPAGDHKIDALLRYAVGRRLHHQNSPVILRLHGVLGNLLDETEHFLPTALADWGYASIPMNTALANLGLFYGFGRQCRNIDATQSNRRRPAPLDRSEWHC